MEEKKEDLKKKSYGVLLDALFVFIGKTIGAAIMGFTRAFIGGLVLAYPFKWFWNALRLKLTDLEVLEISYWTAFKILLLIGVLFRRQIVVKDILEAERDEKE